MLREKNMQDFLQIKNGIICAQNVSKASHVYVSPQNMVI